MPYPASTKTLQALLALADGEAERMRQTVQDFRNASDAGAVERSNILQLVGWLDRAIASWDEAIARGEDMARYAQAQKGTFDVAAEFMAMRAAAVDLRDWLDGLKSDSGRWDEIMTVSRERLEDFRTRADAFVATVS